jgi:citrate lyase subunit beta/citryl-CoA lyase
VLNLAGIAAADPAIRVLVLGLEDLALETRIRRKPGRSSFAHILSHCVLVARAHGLDMIDGVFTQLDDEQGFEAECQQACELGFDGKSLVHPRQVEPCNRAFTPSPEDIADAQAIVAAWQQQSASGHSVIVVAGRMIEQLHVTQAQRVLALAAATSGQNPVDFSQY